MVSSHLMSLAPAAVRVYAITAKGASGGAKKEKNPLDFVLDYLTTEDQFYETDLILKKVEKEQGTTGGRGTVRGGGKSSAPVPMVPKKNDGGGFAGLGGLFNKK